MAEKKSFAGGISALLGESSTPKAKAAKQQVADELKPEKPQKPAEIYERTTIPLSAENLKKMKALAFYERKDYKELWKEILEFYFHERGDNMMKEALELFDAHHKK